jgi:hypothetical protein
LEVAEEEEEEKQKEEEEEEKEKDPDPEKEEEECLGSTRISHLENFSNSSWLIQEVESVCKDP